MSIFGGLLGELDDDPFVSGHMRGMNNLMNSFFRDPFGDMLGRSMGSELMPFAGERGHRGHNGHNRGRELAGYGMGFPFLGFPNVPDMFHNINTPNCHSFSSSTVMTMTSGPDGRPQVYQASQSVKQGPGGVRETKKSVSDSRTGVKKLAIGHHINDRAHIIEREQNVYSGEQEERQDFINLDEDEADTFNKEWETKARTSMRNNAIEYGKNSRRRQTREPQLALPSTHSYNVSRDKRYSRVHNRPSPSVVSHTDLNTSASPNTPAHSIRSDSEDDDDDDVDEEPAKKRKLDDETSREDVCPKQKQTKHARMEKDHTPSSTSK